MRPWLLALGLLGCASASTPGSGGDDGPAPADARVDVPPDACGDGDGDGVCDVVDACPGHDDGVDADADTVADGCDVCPMADDRVDVNLNSVPDCSELETFTANVKVVNGNYWRGWYTPTTHSSTNDNTLTGLYNNVVYNSYFVFPLPTVTATAVASVKLELELHVYTGDASETVSVWDVSTAPGTVETSGGSAAIHSDLMTGVQYGTGTLAVADANQVVSIPLPMATADVRLRLGGDFAVGLHNDTAPGHFRFSQASEARIARLVVEYLP